MSESFEPDVPPWEEPQPPDHLPPWEVPGAVRRDCEPHRGGLLHVLGTIALVSGALSLCCVPLGFVGLPLGIAVCYFARRDLKDMEAGIMEPGGKMLTAEALKFGQVGIFFGSVAIVIWTYILAVALG